MIFLGGNGNPSRLNYLERKKYKDNIKFPDIEFIDLWYEKPNYGLYNSHYEPVTLLDESLESTMSPFGEYASPTLYAASFVVRAFNDFRESYTQQISQTSIQFPPFIEGLVPTRAHVGFHSSYSSHVKKVASSLLSSVEASKKTIFDFKDFMALCKDVMYSSLEQTPITKSGFLLSSTCPINVSGLCVELATLPYDVDFEKGQFLQTKEFKCYAEQANAAGFYVDKNVPWRLIANMESPVMRGYISEYFQGTSVENVLDRFFRTKTHYDDLDAVMRFFEGVYLEFVDSNPLFLKTEINPSSLEGSRTNIPRPGIESSYQVEYWISELLDIRHRELSITLSSDELFERKRKVLDLQSVYGVSYNSQGYSLKPALGKIGLYCSEYLRRIYENKKTIDSYSDTKLKDYM